MLKASRLCTLARTQARTLFLSECEIRFAIFLLKQTLSLPHYFLCMFGVIFVTVTIHKGVGKHGNLIVCTEISILSDAIHMDKERNILKNRNSSNFTNDIQRKLTVLLN